MQPLLTLAIPTFNRADSLRDTLSSVECGLALLPQGLRDQIELLVSNNASTDHTREVCADFESLRYVEQPDNLGYDGNIRDLYSQARGRFVLFLSDDDVFEAAGLPILISMLKCNPGIDVVFCNWYACAPGRAPRSFLPKKILDQDDEFAFEKVGALTPFYFLSSFVLRHVPVELDHLLKGTYATQMDISLEILNPSSRCLVMREFLVGRIEPETELEGGNNNPSVAWRIHLGFTRVRRRFQDKFDIPLSPVAELSSVLSAWQYFANPSRSLASRFKVFSAALLSGLIHTQFSRLLELPAFLLQRARRHR